MFDLFLILLNFFLLLYAFLYLWCAFWGIYYENTPKSDEVHFFKNEDDWRLALLHYKTNAKEKKTYPVLMVHGLGVNHTTFDLKVAEYLTSKGFDVWALDLRGHGLSEKPKLFNKKKFGWSVDDYIKKDLPAAIDEILKKTGAKKLHYIGHSNGGIILYSYLSTTKKKLIKSAVTVGSALEMADSESNFHHARKLEAFIEPFSGSLLSGLALGPLMKFLSPFVGRFPTPLDKFDHWPANTEGKLVRVLFANNYNWVSFRVLKQLSTAFDKDGFSSLDTKESYAKALRKVKDAPPILAIAGSEDRQVPADASEKTLKSIPGKVHQYICFGTKNGNQHEYGHFDLLMGKNVTTETFPEIEKWFSRHDA